MSLLLQEILSGRLDGFFLQRQVHALMAAVLLRVGGLVRSSLMPSRSHHTESLLGPKSAAELGKGTPFAVPIFLGRPKILEDLFENAEGVSFAGTREGLAADQVVTGEVGGGTRVAAAAIGEQELALVVWVPEVTRQGKS
jgi:hypothetical protein